jgi:hypothetical protein
VPFFTNKNNMEGIDEQGTDDEEETGDKRISLNNNFYSFRFFREHITKESLSRDINSLDKKFYVQRIRFIECTFEQGDDNDGLFVYFFSDQHNRSRPFYVPNVITEFEGYGGHDADGQQLPSLPFRSIKKLVMIQYSRILSFKRTTISQSHLVQLLMAIEFSCNHKVTAHFNSPLMLSIESHNITYEIMKRIYSLCTCVLWKDSYERNNFRHLSVKRTFYPDDGSEFIVKKLKRLDDDKETKDISLNYTEPVVHEIKMVRVPLLDISISNAKGKVFFITVSDTTFDICYKRYRKCLFEEEVIEYSPLFYLC